MLISLTYWFYLQIQHQFRKITNSGFAYSPLPHIYYTPIV